METQHPGKQVTDDIRLTELLQVNEALNDPRWVFRTVTGIESQTCVDAEKVTAVLDHFGIARKSPLVTKEGEAVYTPADKKMTPREVLAAIRWVFVAH